MKKYTYPGMRRSEPFPQDFNIRVKSVMDLPIREKDDSRLIQESPLHNNMGGCHKFPTTDIVQLAKRPLW